MNIKIFESVVGERLVIDLRFFATAILIIILSYMPFYFSCFVSNMLLLNAVFFSQYFMRVPPTYFAYFIVGVLADLRFDSVLGFYGFMFVLFAFISQFIHEHIRLKKYYFLWGVNITFGCIVYLSEYLLNSLSAQHWFSIQYLMIKILLLAALYPGVVWLFSKVSQRLFGANAS